MSNILYQKLNVFISSPGDVAQERKIAKDMIHELNAMDILGNCRLEPCAYEDIVPGVVGELPQLTVDRYMLRPQDADILVCILWSRMGTPFVDDKTNTSYQSGTEYEFIHAYRSYKERQRPIILLYRCTRQVDPLQIDTNQLNALQRFFRDIVGNEGEFKGLYRSYAQESDFSRFILQDLLKIVYTDFISRDVLPSQPQPEIVEAPSPTQVTEVSQTEIRKKFLEANAELRNYPSLIGGKVEIQRGEVEQVTKWVNAHDPTQQLALLIDIPGSGKTVVMAQVLKRLEEAHKTVLAIKADYLSGIKKDSDLQERLKLPMSVEDCIQLLAAEDQVIVLVDQLDALSVALSQDFATLDVVYRLILRLSGLQNVCMVVSCREFDLNFDPSLSTLRFKQYQKFVLTPLNDDQINGVLHAIGIRDVNRISKRMRQLFSIPLHLSLYAELLRNEDVGVVEDEFHSLHQLYEHLWQKYILSCPVPNVVAAINVLVEAMQKERRLAAPVGLLDTDEYRAAGVYLQRVNFIRNEKGNYVFLHQTLFDYCYARRFIAGGNSLADTISKSSQGLFERSQMIQVLVYLRSANPSKYLTEMVSLLFAGKIRFHLRLLLVEWFAALPDPSEDEYSLAKRLLQDPQDEYDFLRAAQGNVGWFDRLNNDFLPSVLRSGDDAKVERITLNYLASLVSFRTDAILTLLSPYKNRSTHWNGIIMYCLSHKPKIFAIDKGLHPLTALDSCWATFDLWLSSLG